MDAVKIFFSLIIVLALNGCGSSMFGKKVNEPFSGAGYQSNNRFLRASGKGESSSDPIARSKADMEAKTMLAGQVSTTMKQVTDEYKSQVENERAADVEEKFQSLSRQVVDADLADVRKMDEKKYYNNKSKVYTYFIAYEIKKNAMFRFMKKLAKANKNINESQYNAMEKILDAQIDKTED